LEITIWATDAQGNKVSIKLRINLLQGTQTSLLYEIQAGEALKAVEEIPMEQDFPVKEEPVVASVSKEKINPDYDEDMDPGLGDLADIMVAGFVASGTFAEPRVGKGPGGFQEQLWLAANSFELERRAFLKSIGI